MNRWVTALFLRFRCFITFIRTLPCLDFLALGKRRVSYCVVVAIVFLISSCREKYTTYENNAGIKPALLAQIDTPNFTIIDWKDSVKNFGVITEGDSIKIDFDFENAGKTPLFILAIKPSCGCTTVDYPRNIILPGEKGKITAIFTTPGQPPGKSVKSIMVKANTKNSMHHALVFKGEIKKRPS